MFEDRLSRHFTPQFPAVVLRHLHRGVVEVTVVSVLIGLRLPRAASRVPFPAKVGTRRWAMLIVQIAAVLVGAFLIYQTIVTGHTGAQAAWMDWRAR